MVEVVADASFEDFVARRSGALLRFATLVTGNQEDARDAVQDALLGLFRRWDRVTGPDAYVRRSIVNAHVSRWRATGAEVVAFDPDRPHPDPATPFTAVDDQQFAGRLFAALPLRSRAALVMRFYEQASFAEIAAALGVAEPTARSLVHRALTSLRRTLQERTDA